MGAIAGIVVVVLVVVILLVAVIIIMGVVWRRRQSGEFVVVHWQFLVFWAALKSIKIATNFGVHFGCKVLTRRSSPSLLQLKFVALKELINICKQIFNCLQTCSVLGQLFCYQNRVSI